MTYLDRHNNHIRFTVAIVMTIALVVFSVATICEWDRVYNYTSPVVTFLAALLIFLSRELTGKYWPMVRLFMIGIFIWFLGDIVWIVETYFLPDNEVITIISDNIYLIPDYFYLAGMVAYAKIRFEKNDLHLLIIDSLVLGVVAFIIVEQALENKNPDFAITWDILNHLLYLFASMYMLLLLLLICYKSGLKRHTWSFYVLLVTIFTHNVLEIRYTAKLFMGEESESPFFDIFYLVVMTCISSTLSFGNLYQVNITEDARVRSKHSHIGKNFKWVYWFNACVLMAMAGVLYAVGFFKGQDIFYIFAISMAYIIMCKTVQANVLADELIENQKNENARLEQMVEEKTRELREMNEYLRKISDTDALTGLYNRRYGIDYLSKLVKDAEYYPIALYSLDLNYFKPINDNYGHDMGDVVLKEVGKRLMNLGQERCTAIRIGGDEFLVIFRNASSASAIENVGKLICSKMDEPIEAHVVTEDRGEQHETFTISASIGVARYPADTTDLESLLKCADEALYKIKHTHEKSAYLLYKVANA